MFSNVYFLPAVELSITLIVLVLLRVLASYILKKSGLMTPELKKIFNLIMVIIFFFIAIFVFISTIHTISVNEVPRSVIDRGNVFKQQKQFEKTVKKGSEQ